MDIQPDPDQQPILLRSLREMIGQRLETTDNHHLTIRDFYFDDQAWIVRYFTVSTGKWLSGRHVLLSPLSLTDPTALDEPLPVALSRDEIRRAPSVDTDRPVSRQDEEALSAYYKWAPYWHDVGRSHQGDPHLRGGREVTGYRIHAKDGDIGHVDDFIAQAGLWGVRYMAVNTGTWLPGRRVLIAVSWIEAVEWEDGRVRVDLTKDEIRTSPPYDLSGPINRHYESALFRHYGREAYWRNTGSGNEEDAA